ncbi:MAG: hypothetical protein GTO45_13680 [Candidatus Aminicenantes bacterium]|nr:hypothetical protein [Candidatus Aminicenantes bacterium]NIM79826.1 hypothetical protein [Candidatus Aminicenantes bacterium]NIN19156.1 hypothetical protein [Candidatus Aminicenantes bacterium]NIN43060.1 hypothetical protein [Candidatus Aminicenantes bacterium]NIN85801.1 hypothetical protein [Candidatus Aminicenantes bacterium]
MTETQIFKPIRGALKTQISTSTETITAGQEFSIFVNIQNPFEVPIAVKGVSTHLPTEFIDVEQKIRELQAVDIENQLREIEDAGHLVDLEPSSTPIIPRQKSKMSKWLQGISINVGPFKIDFNRRKTFAPAIARDLKSSKDQVMIQGRVGLNIPFLNLTSFIKKDLKDERAIDSKKKHWQERLEVERKKYQNALEYLKVNDNSKTVLQPGNSTTNVFTLKSKRTSFFKPSSYLLHIEVVYEIEGIENIDTIDFKLTVKSSIRDMVFGAIVGSFAGWFVKNSAKFKWDISTLVNLAISLVFAAMVVIIFARKKEVQPIIAIEDFWGGIALGFLVSYSGQGILNGLFSSSPNG